MAPLPADNPHATPSPHPDGLPPFDRLRVEHHGPALAAGMAAHREEVEAILAEAAEPTFANTVEALERAGDLLRRVVTALTTLLGCCSEPALRDLEAEWLPRLAAHQDAIDLDPRLFDRVDALQRRRDALGLSAEQQRVLDRHHTTLVRAGARLPAEDQDRLRALNSRLSGLEATFRRDLLAETDALAVHVEDRQELEGLGDDGVSAAAQAAAERGKDGFLLPLALPTQQPALARLEHRGTRRRLWEASVARGARQTTHDTRATLTEIAALRAERAGLLGYASHAAWVIEDETAPHVDAVMDMLGGLAPVAVANVAVEADELARQLAADGVRGPLEPWDWTWCRERLRGERFALDHAALAPWFELDRVLTAGAFAAAGDLFGLRFRERPELPGWHDDVRVWQVSDEDGEPVGLFCLDPFAREGKHGGAWMTLLQPQSALLSTRPVVGNVLNVPRPGPGEPALLTPDEVRTLFHELGHALHGLLSAVEFPSLSGTNVPADFVEFPSQLFELWAWEPASLARYARHHATEEPLPEGVADRLRSAERFGQGQATAEILAAMLLDQAWHGLAPGERIAPSDVERFERDALARHGLDLPLVPPRYRSAYFEHVWGGGYSAGYYAYLWAEVLDADAAAWFTEHGALERASGERLRKHVLSRGFTVDPMAAYRAFRGRDPELAPLLERRGLGAMGDGVTG